ncbi:NAD(P)-dependent alcohol dehydrogenase [Paucibacter sp. R3-3]|uniref:NAD(P)-dependent alcohol dehydrogenase n=1 Tax=Roseateles agri TaxID=3098619 RepID=A0ABU5DPH6_9BURK|nr:NAD(P)-dependent alcohol dehydrogenase [Paucibacter sp. R3-3]MDY0748198.1 NAD(P)-dependent alcohol dehydrogenase [Paucibacter sp. R3-3]
MTIQRRELRPDDVEIAIAYCGVCHSDAHQAHNDWKKSIYPMVPGHEIVGHVIAIGSSVTSHAVGDTVAVGCMVDSCLDCAACVDHEEQHCENGAVGTYNSRDCHTGEPTAGGYSQRIVVRENFVLSVPPSLDLRHAAPLLCAGITLWSPLRRFDTGPGKRVAIVGLGGLGHMGVKLASALGAEVTIITTSQSKGEDAKALGAHHVLLSTDPLAMTAAASRFDLIVDTIPVAHDVGPYIGLLARNGKIVVVGAIDVLPPIHAGMLLRNHRSLVGSAIGGLAATQEMLNFCAEHQVLPKCEVIAMQDINTAWARMQANDVRYRFVIDMSTLAA